MKLPAFENKGRFWRGNLHSHSTNSDGVLSPKDICLRYKNEGYDFLAVTDPFVGVYNYPITDTSNYREPGFTTLLGAEVHSGSMENGELWHILSVGIPKDFQASNSPHFLPVDGQETGPEIAKRCAEAGAFVAIAHPQWSGMTVNDARSITSAHAVEVYNHGCAVGCDRPDGFHTLDLLLSEGHRLDLVATDDSHFNEPDHFGGWVMVKSELNQQEDLIKALKAGAYYSTQGPEFKNIEVNDKVAKISSTAVCTVIVQGQGSAAVAVHGNSLTSTEVPLSRFKNSPWIRITIVNASGQRAWSNPVWRD